MYIKPQESDHKDVETIKTIPHFFLKCNVTKHCTVNSSIIYVHVHVSKVPSQPCFCGFSVLISLHALSFLKCFFISLCFSCVQSYTCIWYDRILHLKNTKTLFPFNNLFISKHFTMY